MIRELEVEEIEKVMKKITKDEFDCLRNYLWKVFSEYENKMLQQRLQEGKRKAKLRRSQVWE